LVPNEIAAEFLKLYRASEPVQLTWRD